VLSECFFIGVWVRMAARAIVDVELHCRRMTLDGAAAFYEAEAVILVSRPRNRSSRSTCMRVGVGLAMPRQAINVQGVDGGAHS
jgi:hypothetical protein